MVFIKREPKGDGIHLYLAEEYYDQREKKGKIRKIRNLGKECSVEEPEYSTKRAIVWEMVGPWGM